MDMLYLKQPLFLLFPIVLVFWQLLTYYLKIKIHISLKTEFFLTVIGVLLHTISITVILLNNGSLSDVLLLVLLSGVLSLLLSPKPNKTKVEEDEG